MAGEIIDLSELDAVDILSGARVYSSARVPRLEPNIKGVYVTQDTDGDCQVFAGNGRENLRIRRETGSIGPGSARLKSENRAGMTLITFALETTMKPTNSLTYREPSDFIRWKVEAKGVTDVFSALTHLAFRKILCSKSKEELMPRQPRLSRPGFPHSSNALAVLGLLGFSGFLVAGECEPDETNRALLDRVNEARSQPRRCGDENFDAAEPLSWNCKLEDAAKAHSEDMAKLEYFSHTGPDGVQIGERVRSRSYSWSAVGENIAAGQSPVDEVVDGWLSSPGHCANIMSTKFTEMGAARVDAQGSRYSPFWTQVFGRPAR